MLIKDVVRIVRGHGSHGNGSEMPSEKLEKVARKKSVKAMKKGRKGGEKVNGDHVRHLSRLRTQPTRDAGKAQENFLGIKRDGTCRLK